MIFIIEGPDNIGKSSIIKMLTGILAKKGIIVHKLHYSAIPGLDGEHSKDYSECMYTDMFEMLLHQDFKKVAFILDRSHIGEMVYSPLYRGYSGDYVLDIEKRFLNFKSFWKTIHLITLIDSPDNLIERDDGLSFTVDINKKTDEIDGFIDAFDLSNIKNKCIIYCNTKDLDQVKQEVRNYIEDKI